MKTKSHLIWKPTDCDERRWAGVLLPMLNGVISTNAYSIFTISIVMKNHESENLSDSGVLFHTAVVPDCSDEQTKKLFDHLDKAASEFKQILTHKHP